MKISRTSVLALIATVSLAAVPAAQAVAVAGPSAQQVSTAAEPAAVTSGRSRLRRHDSQQGQ